MWAAADPSHTRLPLCSGTVGYKRRTFVGSPLWMVRCALLAAAIKFMHSGHVLLRHRTAPPLLHRTLTPTYLAVPRAAGP